MTETSRKRIKEKGADANAAPSVMEKTRVKMLCLDLDGTLLTDEKTVSKENVNAVQAAYEKGVDIVVATGRQYRKARDFAACLSLPVTIIANNGASIRHSTDDRRVYFSPMPMVLAKEIIGLAKDFGIAPIVHVDRYDEGKDIGIGPDVSQDVVERYGLLDSDWVFRVDTWSDTALRDAVSMVFFGSRRQIARWHEHLSQRFLPPYVMHHLVNLQKFEAMLEVLGDTGNKWHGIRELANQKKILPREILAIGDDNNDIEMLKNTGFSFAPKNATQEVKKAAARVLDQTNNEHAVAAAIEEVIL
ncbi:MAG: HAD family hydrolase [Tissierellia bacterium]|nr:HAD family hydrolase [Bacillota bacterium]NLK57818.1 HAD family hydrolase [Tissierellia bacterium]